MPCFRGSNLIDILAKDFCFFSFAFLKNPVLLYLDFFLSNLLAEWTGLEPATPA